MKAQLGRPTGLALALLSALLATILAIGVYGVAQAQESQATRSFSPATAEPGATVEVTITIPDYERSVIVTETLPDGFTFESSDDGGRLQGENTNTIGFVLISGIGPQVSSVSYKVEASATATDGAYNFAGTYVVDGGDSVAIGGASSVTVAAGATDGNGDADSPIKLSSQEPGAAVQITLEGMAATGIEPNQDITIELKGFGMPETIADTAISITSAGFKGSPTGVLVTGSKITMTVPQVRANGDPQTMAVSGGYSIRIKQAAGISNPASGGDKTITLQENAPDGDKKDFTAAIDRVIKLSSTAGTRGTMTTATFKGFANGSATVFLNDPNRDNPEEGPAASSKHAEVVIADNTGTLPIDTTSSNFKANQENIITAQDAAGNNQDVSGKFTISPKVVLDPEETSVSKMVTIKLSDWPTGNDITEVKIGATAKDNGNYLVDQDTSTDGVQMPQTDTDGKAEFKVLVPSGVNRGTQTVKVTGTDPDGEDGDKTAPSASESLEVGVLSLSAQPAMVVPGQQITIQGSGFVANDSFNSVTVGGIAVPISPAVRASSAGDIVITINVPSRPATSTTDAMPIGDGKKTIVATAIGSNRVAEGEIEIPKAAITLDPVTSRRGTTVNVSGIRVPVR